MNRMPLLVFGVFLAFASGWLGLVAYPYVTLGQLEPVVDENTGGVSPPPMPGLAVAGQKIYAANGCVYCHSQDIRPGYLTADIAREPEADPPVRRTVSRDYLRDKPALVGSMRIGPDLANFGLEKRVATLNDIHRRLYDPRSVVPGSIMPSYRYLYKLQPISGQPSNDAVAGLTGPHAPKPGFEVVPTPQARVLAAYLLSLKRNYPLAEAPVETKE